MLVRIRSLNESLIDKLKSDIILGKLLAIDFKELP